MSKQHHRCPADYSCHLINQMQDTLDTVVGVDHVDATTLRELLEQIREVNEDLREWGSEEATQVDNLNVQLELHFPYDMEA
jgi:hypothetical protein